MATNPKTVRKFALFFRRKRDKDNSVTSGTVPRDWTLCGDELIDTWDAAVLVEEELQRHYGSCETAIREVVITRPPDSLFDDIHG